MIKTKRDSLERFIRTQMEGPGACNNRFSLTDSREDGSIEVINTTPGSLYSTAILFPKRVPNLGHISSQNEDGEEGVESIPQNAPNPLETNDESDQDNDLDEKKPALTQSEEDDLYSLSQRFPNAIGISCCLDAGGSHIKGDDVKIIISGRYYTKIVKGRGTNILIRISEHYLEFQEFYNRYKDRLINYFLLKPDGVSSARDFSKEHLEVRKLLLDINLDICREIARNTIGEYDQTYFYPLAAIIAT